MGTITPAMLSVLIVNWNTRDHLDRCLASLQANPPELPMEVIVVDNASSDGSEQMVRDNYPQVKLVQSGANLGYAAGNNLAFKHARGDWLLTLNPDTEVGPGALQKAVETLAAHPECASLAVRLILPDGSTQKTVRAFPTLANILGDLLPFPKNPNSKFGNYRRPNFDYKASQYAEQPMGSFLLFSRQDLVLSTDFPTVFDEVFPIFFNEVDLLYRLNNRGFKCWYEAGISVFHHHGGTTRLVKKSMIWESHKSLVRYFSKHLTGASRLALPLVAVASYAAALVRARGYHAGFRP